MVNFGWLAAEIGSLLWDTPANGNGFRVLASLLQQRPSTEASQTLHNTVSCARTLYIHFRVLLPHNGILPGPKFTLRPSPALSYIGSITARQWSSGHQPKFAALTRGCQLYSSRRPSRWGLVHIIIILYITLLEAVQCKQCCYDVS